MLKIVSAAQMRAIDRRAIEEMGVPGLILMENAGINVVRAIQERHGGKVAGLRVNVFAGKGNNGGDGLAAARHLSNLGAQVTVFLAADPAQIKGDAKVNLNAFAGMGGAVKRLDEGRQLRAHKLKFMHASVVVDALFGTGFTGAPGGLNAQVIEIMNQFGAFKVAVDIPSGLAADSGAAPSVCFRADVTVAFGLPKIAHVTSPARNFVGKLVVADISLPPRAIEESACEAFLVEAEDVAAVMPPRAWDAHKGHFGHVVIAGGSPGMGGAVAMAGAGALRVGAGLVTAMPPRGLAPAYETGLPEMMTRALPETEAGTIDRTAAEPFLEFARDKTAALVGPGLTTHTSTRWFVHEVAQNLAIPLVIDADGLNLIGRDAALIKTRAAPTIVTPHPGEMGRLLGITAKEIQADRLGAAKRYAAESGAVVVLKGAGTVTATPDGPAYINHTGNNGLATGGSGDVLAGMIAGFLAQGAHPEDAAVAGVYLHGRAADLYAARYDARCLMPTDLLGLIPEAVTELRGDAG